VAVEQWLIVVGGALQIGGVVTTAVGITRRRNFAGLPGILERALRKIRSWWRRLRKKPQIIQVSAAGAVSSAGNLRASLKLGFQGTLDARVKRLQEIAQRHEDKIGDLEGASTMSEPRGTQISNPSVRSLRRRRRNYEAKSAKWRLATFASKLGAS